MKKTLTIATLLAVLLPASAALADEDCFEPMANWQPRGVVADFALDAGWVVQRIKIDDGCYEIMGFDPEGRAIEVTLNPATLEILDMEYEDAHQDDREHHGDEGYGHD